MKTLSLFGGIGVLAFILAGAQAGLFHIEAQSDGDDPASPQQKKESAKPAKTRFPLDLAPAARAEPVPRAAAFDRSGKPHRIAILKTNGALYDDWQERLKDEWQADTVENTAIVIVVGQSKKTFVEIIHYPGGAPPISRYKHELEASIIEAKTGKVLANRQFINMPRNIVRIETWDTTALGSPVDFRTVFHWAAAGILSGFPRVDNGPPIINVVN